jgi:hypothetical protein
LIAAAAKSVSVSASGPPRQSRAAKSGLAAADPAHRMIATVREAAVKRSQARLRTTSIMPLWNCRSALPQQEVLRDKHLSLYAALITGPRSSPRRDARRARTRSIWDFIEKNRSECRTGTTQERKVIKKYDLFLRAKQYLFLEGYNPRMHAVYLCPQLYKYDGNQKLVPLQDEEIGQLIAHALTNRVAERRPWYDPSEKLPEEPIISAKP